jgi:hypothetical protein
MLRPIVRAGWIHMDGRETGGERRIYQLLWFEPRGVAFKSSGGSEAKRPMRRYDGKLGPAMNPPSRTNDCPVINDARSEHIHTTASAISIDFPNLPMG